MYRYHYYHIIDLLELKVLSPLLLLHLHLLRLFLFGGGRGVFCGCNSKNHIKLVYLNYRLQIYIFLERPRKNIIALSALCCLFVSSSDSPDDVIHFGNRPGRGLPLPNTDCDPSSSIPITWAGHFS